MPIISIVHTAQLSDIVDVHGRWFDAGPVNVLLAKHSQLSFPYRSQFGLATLEVSEGVFCPTLTNVSPFMLEAVDFSAGPRVLDAFCGSGAFGINAALRGSEHVVSVDLSPVAVECAIMNTFLNGVAENVEVRAGDAVDSIGDHEEFDLIIANPPLLPAVPTTDLEAAVFDPGLQATVRFLSALHRFLAPGGRCYFLTSSVVERFGFDFERLCSDSGLVSRVGRKIDFPYETYRVHEIVLRCDSKRRDEMTDGSVFVMHDDLDVRRVEGAE